MTDWDDMAVVGRITRPHGLRGQVMVNPATDFAEDRFKPGEVVWTRTARGDEQLTIGTARVQGARPVLRFEGVSSIDQAEGLVGLELRVPEGTLQPLGQGMYYLHQLTGCVVTTTGGAQVGTVAKVDSGIGSSRLVIEGERGEILIPLAAEICIEIDVDAKRIVIEPPDGLLDLNETKRTERVGRTERIERPERPNGPTD